MEQSSFSLLHYRERSKQMTSPLRAGIIGAGFMAVVHARAIRNSGHELVGIASSSAETAATAAKKLQVPNVFSSWQELVASDLIDVVHVCTPNELHSEIKSKISQWMGTPATKTTLDTILDKINVLGMDSLTKHELTLLQNYSNN